MLIQKYLRVRQGKRDVGDEGVGGGGVKGREEGEEGGRREKREKEGGMEKEKKIFCYATFSDIYVFSPVF